MRLHRVTMSYTRVKLRVKLQSIINKEVSTLQHLLLVEIYLVIYLVWLHQVLNAVIQTDATIAYSADSYIHKEVHL